MSTFSAELLQFLKRPDSYPHNPQNVEHIQTHISHVFIVPPYVYKFKKPVDFGFLDYSTLSSRKKYCRREVELNRRLSDDIYLGVIPVIKKNDHFTFGEVGSDADSAVEYAVKMNKLADEYFLHSYLENNTLTLNHMDRVADKLADFYNQQQPSDEILKWGRIENIKVNTDENFEQTESFIGRTVDQNTFDAVKNFTNSYFEQHAGLFEQRIREKRIVDGHGDLHLDHIHITDEKVQIYDCIEFNERFRYGDLAVDLAYLAMDLDFNDCWQEERYFIRRMSEKLDDPDLPKLIDFYKCYRAYVKAKVKSLQSDEEEVPEDERKRAASVASRYFNLSLRYALIGSQPTILACMGRVGTGKSTVANYLQEKLNIEYFSTDRIRKNLAGLPIEERTPDPEREKLYSTTMSAKTYGMLYDKAEDRLDKGKSVILDATFSTVSSRKKLLELTKEKNYQLYFIETRAPDEVIKQRLKKRDEESAVISDARLEDFEKLNQRYQPPKEMSSNRLIPIETNHTLEETVMQLYSKLSEQNLKR